MLDENLPTYRFKPSTDNPLNTLLYFSHNGSEPLPEYMVKRPEASASRNQYAIGLVDAQQSSVVYAEVLLQPEWSQPTLSAAEVRAQSGPVPQIPNTPDGFAISLYNPDQSVAVRQHQGSWGKSDAWEFEIPERTFRVPSASKIDQEEGEAGVSDLSPKLVFRWKRDGRLSKDMTCFMTGKSLGGMKNKDPDITIAMFRAKHDAMLTVYEPNMNRVEVEDRKGLEMALILSAEVIKDLYLNPRQDPFNVSTVGASSGRRRTNSRPPRSPTTVTGPAMSGALNSTHPSPPLQAQPAHSPPPPPPQSNANANAEAQRRAEIDAETRRLQAMVAEEERQKREREKREQEEQKKLQKLVEKEEKARRKREVEVEKETERLRREYGMEGQDFGSSSSGPTATSPQLPPRPTLAAPTLPPRPSSVGPTPSGNMFFPGPPQQQFQQQFQQQPPPQQQQQQQQQPSGKKHHGLGGLLQNAAPYTGPAAATVSGFFGKITNDDKRKKVQKKRSF